MLSSALLLAAAALLALGALGWLVGGRAGWLYPATFVACAVGMLSAFVLLAGVPAPALYLPGTGAHLVLDGLSGCFLLLLFVLGCAASLFMTRQQGERTTPFFPVLIAGMALTLLAGDALVMLLGIGVTALASWALMSTHSDDDQVRGAALLYPGMVGLGVLAIFGTLALLGGFSELSFAAMRSAPPTGWRAIGVLIFVLLGAGSLAGLAPLHVWLPPACTAAPSHVSALLSGAATNVAFYVLIRVLFDLSGGAQPIWWGVPLLLMGAASAVLGALRAALEPDMKSVLACSTIANAGLIAIGLGVALIARGTDLIPLATLALASALLLALTQGLFKSLLFLGAGAVERTAETRRLRRLGGLIRGMPVTTACMLAGAAGMTALPPGPGFPGEWLLFQSMLAAPHVGGLLLQVTFAAVAALIGLAVALSAAAAIRLVGVAFLGRPRVPRTAAAEEVDRPAQASMIALAALASLVGLVPSTVLALAAPALRRLLHADMADRISVLTVAPQADAPGYSAFVIIFLLVVAGAGALAALRLYGARGERRGPAWESGFAAPPPWLPFGDPAAQCGAASFTQILRRVLGGPILDAREWIERSQPGDSSPARVHTAMRDPAEARLIAVFSHVHARVPATRRAGVMMVVFAAFIVLLAVLAWIAAS